MTKEQNTHPVPDDVFRTVYDSPASLPGQHKWVTPDDDVRKIEDLLGMEQETIGVPLWVSGDERHCPECSREISWLDIISSALDEIHDRQMIAQVILGDQKFVNTEAPRAIDGVECFECGTSIEDLRSFKCHNWAYASKDMLEVLEGIERSADCA